MSMELYVSPEKEWHLGTMPLDVKTEHAALECILGSSDHTKHF